MRIINVLELVDLIPSKIESFPILEEQLSQDVVKEAEKYMINVIKEYITKFIDENMIFDEEWEEEILDNGYYSDVNGYEVYLIWSN